MKIKYIFFSDYVIYYYFRYVVILQMNQGFFLLSDETANKLNNNPTMGTIFFLVYCLQDKTKS